MVKGVNPDAYICGEIWWNAQRWLQGDQFDGVMNYLITSPLLSFFGGKTLRPSFKHEHLTLQPLDATGFEVLIEQMYRLYDWEINYAQMNVLDSHDMPRALWIMSDDTTALKLCILAMMTLPGAPCIYYGDEIGLSAAGDPYCRGAFPWEEKERWNLEILSHYQHTASLRNHYPVLRTGSFQSYYANGEVYAFLRSLEGQTALVVFNCAKLPQDIKIPMPSGATENYSQVWPVGNTQAIELVDGNLFTIISEREGIIIIFE